MTRQDLLSLSWDSICTSRKTSPGNYCETLRVMQRSDQKLRPFSAFILVWQDKTSSSTSRDSIGTSRKTDSRNYCKTLRAMQLSVQKLSPFSAVIPVWRDKTSSHRVGIPYVLLGKQAQETTVKL